MTYRADPIKLKVHGVYYTTIYYKPKGYTSYYKISVSLDKDKIKSKSRYSENSYSVINQITKDVDLPKDAEPCYGIDVPKCCRDIFDFLDNSWSFSCE